MRRCERVVLPLAPTALLPLEFVPMPIADVINPAQPILSHPPERRGAKVLTGVLWRRLRGGLPICRRTRLGEDREGLGQECALGLRGGG